MISDTLSDAIHEIKQYLNSDTYKDGFPVHYRSVACSNREEIKTVLKAMEKLRIKLDTPTNETQDKD